MIHMRQSRARTRIFPSRSSGTKAKGHSPAQFEGESGTLVLKTLINESNAKLLATKYIQEISRKEEELILESIDEYYEPFFLISAKYSVDYFKPRDFKIKVDENVREVVIYGKSHGVEKKRGGIVGIVKGRRQISLQGEEHIVLDTRTSTGFNMMGKEIPPAVVPHGQSEKNPEILKGFEFKKRISRITHDNAMNVVRRRISRRPSESKSRIISEIFEIYEDQEVFSPVYEARFRDVSSGHLRIARIDGLTGKLLSS